MSVRYVSLADAPREPAGPGVERRVFSTGALTWVRYEYEPGCVFAEHEHPQEQVTVVRQGRLAFRAGGEERVVGPDEAVVLPPGVPHGARVVGEERVITDNILVPPRKEHPHAVE